jgi:cbb3-type cytochrome oxidase maturation protein
MSILFVLIPLGLVLLAIAIAVFVWAVNDGQFDDLDTPAVRILLERDDPVAPHPERPHER